MQQTGFFIFFNVVINSSSVMLQNQHLFWYNDDFTVIPWLIYILEHKSKQNF